MPKITLAISPPTNFNTRPKLLLYQVQYDLFENASSNAAGVENIKPVQIFPDLHANFLTLIHYLVNSGTIEPLSEEAFNSLLTIANSTYIEQMHKAFLEGKDPLYVHLKGIVLQEITLYKQLISGLRVLDAKNLLAIGDDLADRGYCDLYVLLLIERLSQAGCPYATLLSNHGMEFLWQIEPSNIHLSLLSAEECLRNIPCNTRIPILEQRRSLVNLKILLQHALITDAELQPLLSQWINALNLITYIYSETENKLSICTHAPAGLASIEALAHKFNIVYAPSTKGTLMETIDDINTAFKRSLETGNYWNLIRNEVLFHSKINFQDMGKHLLPRSETERKVICTLDTPLYFTAWNRDKNIAVRIREDNDNPYIVEPLNRDNGLIDNTSLCWINGHTGDPLASLTAIELNTNFGKPLDPPPLAEYNIHTITSCRLPNSKVLPNPFENLQPGVLYLYPHRNQRYHYRLHTKTLEYTEQEQNIQLPSPQYTCGIIEISEKEQLDMNRYAQDICYRIDEDIKDQASPPPDGLSDYVLYVNPCSPSLSFVDFSTTTKHNLQDYGPTNTGNARKKPRITETSGTMFDFHALAETEESKEADGTQDDLSYDLSHTQHG